MTRISDAELFDHARAVRERAYAPYSKFKVGAAIEDEKGRLHVGCNVENAAYPLGVCAEGSAISAMIAAGGGTIVRIAIVGGGDLAGPCSPCGGCRQKILEFADERTRVLLIDAAGAIARHALAELLPHAFRLKAR